MHCLDGERNRFYLKVKNHWLNGTRFWVFVHLTFLPVPDLVTFWIYEKGGNQNG